MRVLRRFLAFSLLLFPFLGGFSSALSSTAPGAFSPITFATIPTDSSTYEFTLTYHFEHVTTKCYLLVTLTKYPLQDNEEKKVLNRTYVPTSGADQTFSLVCSIAATDFASGYNQNLLKISQTNSSSYRSQFYLVTLNPPAPKSTFVVDEESGEGTFKRPYTEEWYEPFDGTWVTTPRSYAFSGMPKTFSDPTANIVPFYDMKLTGYGITSSATWLRYKSCVLRIYETDAFRDVGTRQDDATSSWQELTLSLSPNAGESSFRIAAPILYYSADFRFVSSTKTTQCSKAARGLVLPALTDGTPRLLRFSLLITGVGENALDTIRYDFSVLQSKNYIGSSATSAWYVSEKTV